MGCILALLTRVALLVVWIATPLVTNAFNGGWILPLVGIVFLPTTVLAYVAVFAISGSVTGWAWLWIVIGFLFDVGIHTAGIASNRHRVAGYQPS